MAARLRRIAEVALVENRFVGYRGIEKLQAEYESFMVRGQEVNALSALALLSRALLGYGRNEDALALLRQGVERAVAVMDSHPEVFDLMQFELAVGLMRLGESQNCVARHTSQSCILPIGPLGVHADGAAVVEARGIFLDLWRRAPPKSPLSYMSRWLLNVTSMAAGDYPSAVPDDAFIDFTPKSSVKVPKFIDVAGELGLNRHAIAGGAAAEDFDGDGRLDLLVTTWEPNIPMRFYRNVGGGQFEDRSKGAGLAEVLGGFNLVTGDFTGDGAVDAVVLRGGWLGDEGRWPLTLLVNRGDGTFADRTVEWGLEGLEGPTQTAAFSDYDRDGDLDLFIAYESRPDQGANPCRLLRNEGDHFEDATVEAGIDNRTWAKGVAWGDIDGDGDEDLYVSTLHGPNHLYRSRVAQGEPRFEDVTASAGVAGPHDSFATWFWDYDHDGDLDLWVSSYLSESPEAAFVRYPWAEVNGLGETGDAWYVVADWLGEYALGDLPALYRNRGDGTFEDVAKSSGIGRVSLAMASSFGDFDNDGWQDVYLGTGYPGFEALIPNRAFRANGDGTFEDVTLATGLGHLQKGHGVVFADVDNDGDQDIFEQIGGFSVGDRFVSALFQNPGGSGNSVTLDLRGTTSNRLAVGARVAVEVDDAGNRRTIHRTVGQRSSFGASPHRLQVGIGAAERVRRIAIRWPATGLVEEHLDLPVRQLVRITEGAARHEVMPLPP